MAEDKVDLPADLMPFKGGGIDDDIQGGSYEGKGLIGLPDDLKDYVTSENSIPLSPQWLYAKPSECKPGLSASSGVPVKIRNVLRNSTSPLGVLLPAVNETVPIGRWEVFLAKLHLHVLP
ncbi:hypothetical protein Taro_013186, partial [Colocasia esculenta]|nr:hypothetical protein [Colocasia esculenta]